MATSMYARRRGRWWPHWWLAAVTACVGGFCVPQTHGQINLWDVTQTTGMTFRHTDGSSGRKYIVETVSAGLALFDYDNDGDIDIYFLNGSPLRGTEVLVRPRNALYRNDGGWRFSDVTSEAGIGDDGYGLGVTVGDYDNDGDPDLYLNNFGPNVLYRNNGDGTFTNMTELAGVRNGNRVGAGTSFLDVDKDGDIDLYVVNYIDFTYENHKESSTKGFPIYSGPMDYPATAANLYRNHGDGTFSDISVESGIAAHLGSGMGAVSADYDNDGDSDLVVANDAKPNFAFENDGTGKFKEVGLLTGLAYDGNGQVHGNMAVDCGDYDNDGWLDFYVPSYQGELATLYRNLGGGAFEDVTSASGAGAGTLPHVTWGTGFVDFDHDGHRDLFVACGHLQDNIERYDTTSTYHARNIVLRNTGDGHFVNVSDQAGDGLQVCLSSRGAGFDDLDNDGDNDVVILNSRREPTLLRNDSPSGNHWLRVRLRGTKSNRDGVGARVEVTAGDLKLIDEVHSGRGYQSHYGTPLDFGLGRHSRVDRITIRWLGGGVQEWENVPAGRMVTIVER